MGDLAPRSMFQCGTYVVHSLVSVDPAGSLVPSVNGCRCMSDSSSG